MKCNFQSSAGDTCCLLFMNQGLTNSVHSVPQVSRFICVRQKILKPMHLCRPFFPLHIAFCQLSVLGFHCFLQQTTIIVLFSGMFFMLKIKKSLMLPCIKLPVTGTLLSGGCRTLRTYTM